MAVSGSGQIAAVRSVIPRLPRVGGPLARERALFAVLCVVWGTTWLALKIGVTTVPPGLFSGLRWTIAGLVLIAVRWSAGNPIRIAPHLIGRVTLVGVLMISINASVQLYGLRLISSGLGAVIGSALTPISLLGFSVAMGQERFSPRQGAAMALGVAGILALFGPSALAGHLDTREMVGALLVVAGCLTYAAGSVLARPLMRSVPPVELAALGNFIGGGILLVFSVLFEPGARAALDLNWGMAAWIAWFYLLLPGSLGATLIYLLLVRNWGASRAGTYAFVSPVLAVLLGVGLNGETLQAGNALGMVLMLAAAALVLRPARRTPA